MRLTRRDLVAALAAAGVGVGAGSALLADDRDRPLDDDVVETAVALASVLYPSDVDGVESFVTRYVRERIADRPDRSGEIVDAATYLDDYTRAWYDEPFSSLPSETRREVLVRMGADEAEPDPNGSDVERLRHYLVNELLFAFYSTPLGGRLVGTENPPGYPGGLGTYRTPTTE